MNQLKQKPHRQELNAMFDRMSFDNLTTAKEV